MALSLNKQKEKDWNDLIKQQSKAFGWKFKSFFTHKTANNFFYYASFFLYGGGNSISVSLSFKPLIIDEVFWEICDLPENKKLPISFRGNGAFVVDKKEIFGFYLKVIPDRLKEDIGNLFGEINHKVDELQSTITDLDTFVSFVEQHPEKEGEWSDVDILIVVAIAQKEYHKALTLLYYAQKNRGRKCRWGFGDKNFYDLAIIYCQNHS